jgi:two-component system, NarL family, sensor kinase
VNRSDRWIVARPVAQFAVIGLAGLFTVGLATLVASQRIGEREAITDVRTTTLVKAQGGVEPVVTNALPSGDPAAVARVATVVQRDVIDASLVRVKIWNASGKIVYSNEPRLIGATYKLGDNELAALRGGLIQAGVSDLTQPENRFERNYHKLLEVYLPIRTPNGERLLFEAYFRFDVVSASADRIWRSFAPVALGALLVLELLQIPLAYGLARQLRQRQQEREGLLRRALEASDVERRRIASDLHDGVVQDLTGVTFTLAGAARAGSTPAETAELLENAAGSVRNSVTGLRSLLVDIYPPDLEEQGLEVAISELLNGIEDAGLKPSLDASLLSARLPIAVSTLLYRATREALRNVVKHASAHTVDVTVGADAERAWLAVVDDGVGFEPREPNDLAAEGHFGLRGLDGLARDLNGQLTVRDRSSGGTAVELEVPLT